MPLVERGGPQVDEEAKESKEVAQLSEAAPLPTETQASKLLDLLDLLDGPSENAQHPPPLDPTPGDTLIHLLDLPCAPRPPAVSSTGDLIFLSTRSLASGAVPCTQWVLI